MTGTDKRGLWATPGLGTLLVLCCAAPVPSARSAGSGPAPGYWPPQPHSC